MKYPNHSQEQRDKCSHAACLLLQMNNYLLSLSNSPRSNLCNGADHLQSESLQPQITVKLHTCSQANLDNFSTGQNHSELWGCRGWLPSTGHISRLTQSEIEHLKPANDEGTQKNRLGDILGNLLARATGHKLPRCSTLSGKTRLCLQSEAASCVQASLDDRTCGSAEQESLSEAYCAPHTTLTLKTLAVPPVPILPRYTLDERMPRVIHHLRDLISCPKCPPAPGPLLM